MARLVLVLRSLSDFRDSTRAFRPEPIRHDDKQKHAQLCPWSWSCETTDIRLLVLLKARKMSPLLWKATTVDTKPWSRTKHKTSVYLIKHVSQETELNLSQSICIKTSASLFSLNQKKKHHRQSLILFVELFRYTASFCFAFRCQLPV